MRSEEKKDPENTNEDGAGRKVPSGFEKLLKRSKRSTNSATPSSKAEKNEADPEASKKESAKKEEQQETEEGSAAEEDNKSDKEQKNSKSSQKESWREQANNFFFEPNSGGPKWENWLMMAIMGATGVYYVSTMETPSKEITYQELVQQHLQHNDIKMITLCEEKTGTTFKFRAQIESHKGERIHLVLP
jgi:hypothetical protein